MRKPQSVAGYSAVLVRVDVTVSLDGEPYSGFSVDLAPPLQTFLPLVLRNN